MRVSRRALMLGAGAAVVVGATIPPRRSFANSIIKEYRLTTNSATST
jgi:hypothetical protein